MVSDTEEGAGYEEQVISVWLDMDNESGESHTHTPSNGLLVIFFVNDALQNAECPLQAKVGDDEDDNDR